IFSLNLNFLSYQNLPSLFPSELLGTQMATMKAIQPHLPSTIANTNGLRKIYANQETAMDFRPHQKTSSRSNRLA
ncbi:unnamed protein product, partial [Ilex paraguariensis]